MTGVKSTMFEGVKPIEPGQAVRFGSATEEIFPIWRFGEAGVSTLSLTQAGEELRSHLDRAVKAQSRRASGPLSCHLSAGRDSNAVASSAALALGTAEEPLLAFTAAPRSGFAAEVASSDLLDESDLAARTAGLYEERISHFTCRPRPFDLGLMLDDMHRRHYGPLLNPSNLSWWAQINQVAADRGSTLLLASSAGNFSVSAGGSAALGDVLAEESLGAWWRKAFEVANGSLSGWRTVLNQSFGPRIPSDMYALLRNATGRDRPVKCSVPILRQPIRGRAQAIASQRFGDRRPPPSYRATLCRIANSLDNSERMSLARWGVEIRDPTADRRLVDFVLSLPSVMLASPELSRPLFEAAFGRRIPPAVLYDRRRGYQTADWSEVFAPEVVRAEFARYRENSIVRELVDQGAVNRLIDTWPANGGLDLPTIDTYRNKLLGTLALVSFIDVHFPG